MTAEIRFASQVMLRMRLESIPFGWTGTASLEYWRPTCSSSSKLLPAMMKTVFLLDWLALYRSMWLVSLQELVRY
jgi:hypothetical protein